MSDVTYRPGLLRRAVEATTVPMELEAQLAEGGRLVVPVAGVMTVIDVRSGTLHRRADAGLYRFVPLKEGESD